jgi:hypothetical protein
MFLESEIVQKEIKSIIELGNEVRDGIIQFPLMSPKEKIKQLDLLLDLLEKKKILYARLSLSSDPQAILLKHAMIESSKSFGFGDTDMNSIFTSMKMFIDNQKKRIESELA